MDWIKQLNESINYIEANLAGEISYDFKNCDAVFI